MGSRVQVKAADLFAPDSHAVRRPAAGPIRGMKREMIPDDTIAGFGALSSRKPCFLSRMRPARTRAKIFYLLK
jgi:hypothetical protein